MISGSARQLLIDSPGTGIHACVVRRGRTDTTVPVVRRAAEPGQQVHATCSLRHRHDAKWRNPETWFVPVPRFPSALPVCLPRVERFLLNDGIRE